MTWRTLDLFCGAAGAQAEIFSGIGRACLAAYGDAVVPQITEAIGRAVRFLDAA